MSKYEVYNKQTGKILRDDFKDAKEASNYVDYEDEDDQKNLRVRQKTTPDERRRANNKWV